MVQLTGGQALVQSLKREGIDTIFGLPGIQLDWAFDALYEERDNIAVYHTRHEQATSYMADGFARATGKVGTCLVVPGPGLLNAMAGLSTAYACCSPVLCLTGQIQSDMIGVGRGLLHADDTRSPWRRSLRGGVVLALTFLLPVIGWFVILPWVLLSGCGATILAMRTKRGTTPLELASAA